MTVAGVIRFSDGRDLRVRGAKVNRACDISVTNADKIAAPAGHDIRDCGYSPNNFTALSRPIFFRSASLIEQASNQIAAWSTFSNGQSVENRMRSEPTSKMASISVWVRKLPDVVSQKFSWK